MTKEDKIKRFSTLNQEAIPHQIVFAGSSLMEMFPIGKLQKEHGDETIIYNRGIGGFVSKELLENIQTCILDLKPSRLFINIGTNDLSDPQMTISQLMENYDAILTRVEQEIPDIEIYLMAYYPVNYEAASKAMKPCLMIRTNEKITEANLAVKTLAERHGQKYIDVNAGLKDEKGRLRAEYTIEGMHIKEEGYAAIYDDVMSYVREPKWRKAGRAL